MDELEQRLTRVLNDASTTADSAVARLRNPSAGSTAVRSGRGSRHVRTAWLAVGSSLAVAAVAVGALAGGPLVSKMDGGELPLAVAPSQGSTSTLTGSSPAAGTSRGKADGAAPLWSLPVVDERQHAVDQLPIGGSIPLPQPHTTDPRLTPQPAGVPTLVTPAGTVQFPRAQSVLLLAQRRQGNFVALVGLGHDGEDSLRDVRLVIVAPNRVQRELFRAQVVTDFAVSPSGTAVAVSIPTGDAPGQNAAGVLLVDVATTNVTHRLGGHFTKSVWASDRALLLQGDTSLVWRAPWSGRAEPATSSGSSAVPVVGGIVAFDKKGCLRRLGEDGQETGANCGGWSLAGPVSPDGRYVPMEWPSADGGVSRGALDVLDNTVSLWPVMGTHPSWLDSGDVLLTQLDVQDNPAVVRCHLTDRTCVRTPDEIRQGPWRAASWIGK